MAKYKCIKNLLNFEGHPILEKDKIYDISESGFEYQQSNRTQVVDLEFLIESNFVKLFEGELEIQVSEVPDLEFEIEKNYRIQLDVKTTKKKILEIENYIRQTINDFL